MTRYRIVCADGEHHWETYVVRTYAVMDADKCNARFTCGPHHVEEVPDDHASH
jgi:hypothetical protein